MNHYIDIRLRPDPELTNHHILAALYTRLHHALVALQATDIAMVFPGYDIDQYTLGNHLRLCGPETTLAQLLATQWLRGIHDHVSVSLVYAVPARATYRTLRRLQVKSNPERLRRRLMKRHTLTEDEAKKRIPDRMAEKTRLPFVALRSASSGQLFRLFLELGPEEPQPCTGSFNTYGLSATATIPWF